MLQNSISKVCKCFNIFYTIFTQVLDKIENFEFPRNAQCLLSASLNAFTYCFNLLIFLEIFLACVTNKSDVSFNKLKAITHQVEVEVNYQTE